MIAIAGGTLALLASTVTTWINASHDREIELIKAETAFVLEALTDDEERSKKKLNASRRKWTII